MAGQGVFRLFYVSRFSLTLLYVLLSAAEKPEQIKIVRKPKTCRPVKEGGFEKNS